MGPRRWLNVAYSKKLDVLEDIFAVKDLREPVIHFVKQALHHACMFNTMVCPLSLMCT